MSIRQAGSTSRAARARRVLVTGSTDGLGRDAARVLIDDGHAVVLHARSAERAAACGELAARAAAVVIGDLSSATEVRRLADQVNAIGRMDAIIHNAAVARTPDRSPTPEGHAAILAVNTLAPYLLAGWIEKPGRLIYLSSSLHRNGDGSLQDLDWMTRRWSATQAYADSKLYVTALALAVARRWPDVMSHVVDPGWVPTKMGGPHATDDLEMGSRTQAWLAVSDELDVLASGGYWHHQRRQLPARDASDRAFQDRLLDVLAEMTGVPLF